MASWQLAYFSPVHFEVSKLQTKQWPNLRNWAFDGRTVRIRTSICFKTFRLALSTISVVFVMLRAAFLSLAALLVSACVAEVPLQPSWRASPQGILRVDEPTQWRLDKIPNPNATDHLVLETVYSLLQHWPNLRMRNGM